MANSGGIKFIWKIINFSCFKGGILQSPPFSCTWNSMKFEVIIHLMDATVGSDSFSVELHQLKRLDIIRLYCSFAFLDSQGYPLVWKEKAKKFSASYDWLKIHNFIKGSEIFGSRKTEFLPNDILTVQCRIWVDSSNQLIERVPLFAHTQIEPFLKITKNSFTWDVTDLMSFQYDQELGREESMTINGKPLVMKLFAGYYDKLKVRFTVSLFQIHLKVTISVLDISGKKIQLVEGENLFEKNGQEWNLETYLTKNMLKCCRSSFLNNNTTSLHFDCTLSGNVTFNSLVDEDELVTNMEDLPEFSICYLFERKEYAKESENETSDRLDHSDTVTNAIKGMYEEGFLSDFNLRVGDRLFPVHKAILGMRSPVFRAMFTTEMKEMEDNCSIIEDVDGDTLQELLQFVYLDKLKEDMGWESASSLYEAADKYAIETLKKKCSSILTSGLCVASVLDVLKLADMHHDHNLKSSAFEFISMNDKEIVGSEQWNGFEEENKQLAFETFRSLYLHFKKMIK